MKTLIPQLVLFISVALFACNKPTNENNETNQPLEDISTESKINNSTSFDPNDNFRILDTQKNNDYPSSFSDISLCDEWKLKSKNKMKSIIKNARIISEEEFNNDFDHLPCQIVGTITQNSNQYHLSINSGAWITISSPKSKVILGVFNEEDDEEFLSTAWAE